MGFRKAPEPVISQTLQRSGNHHDARERLAVDINALESDEYILEVIVRDLASGETARTRRVFSKTTAAAAGLAEER